MAESIDRLRERIAEVDDRIIADMKTRRLLVKRIARVKALLKMPRRDMTREHAIAERYENTLGPTGVILARAVLRTSRATIPNKDS